MGEEMDREFMYIMMGMYMKELLRMIKEMRGAFTQLLMGMFLLVNLKIV